LNLLPQRKAKQYFARGFTSQSLVLLVLASFCLSTLVAVAAQQLPAKRERVVGALPGAPQQSPTPPDQPEPDAEVVRVETNLVNSLFTAIDKDHHFITTLRAEDVRILENDVVQSISLFERETNRPLSLVILIDTSESQRGVLADEKNAAITFIDSVIRPDKDRAAVVSFTGVPKVEQAATNNLSRLHQGIGRVRIEMSAENARRLAAGEDPLPKEEDPSGYTGIWDALWMSLENLATPTAEGTRRAIVLLSDGDDTSSTIKKQDVIDFAVRSDVVIYSIGIRDANFEEGKLDSGALKKVSDRTGGRAFFPAQPADLRRAFSQIDQELRSQYLIAYSPTNKSRDGSYRRIKLEVVNPDLLKNKPTLLYRQGYYAKKS
jgi:VWFA-related protein